ncbi:MAG: hypothetical protein EBU66_16850 [Bacteroidetes bacterium]|nr:hypothetical protein [Bacteroidota bacterium]
MDTNKKVRVLEDLSKYKDYLTVGKLKKFLEEHPELPDDANVLIQRVEDRYYEENGWGVVLKEGDHYHMYKEQNYRMNEEIKRRKNGEHPKYEMEDPSKFIVELDDTMKEQYHPMERTVRHHVHRWTTYSGNLLSNFGRRWRII